MRKLGQAFFVIVLVTTVAGAGFAGDLQTDGAFVSTRTDGPPLAVSSPDNALFLNADFLDAVEGSALPRAPENVITVATSGGDFDDLAAALDSITDAGPSNPYLILVGPGEFVILDRIDFQDWVDVRGAGPGVTKVLFEATIPGSGFRGVGTVGAGPRTVRDLELFCKPPPDAVAELECLRADEGSLELRNVLLDVEPGVAGVLSGVTVAAGAHLTVTDSHVLNDASRMFGGSIDLYGISAGESASITLRRSRIHVPHGAVGGAFAVSVDDGASVIAEESELVGTAVKASNSDNDARGLIVGSTAGPVRVHDSTVTGRGTGLTAFGAEVLADAQLRRCTLEGSEDSLRAEGTAIVTKSSLQGQVAATGASVVTVEGSEIHDEGGFAVVAGDTAEINVLRSHVVGDFATTESGLIRCRFVTTGTAFGTATTSCP